MVFQGLIRKTPWIRAAAQERHRQVEGTRARTPDEIHFGFSRWRTKLGFIPRNLAPTQFTRDTIPGLTQR